jgi:hypothetical protein
MEGGFLTQTFLLQSVKYTLTHFFGCFVGEGYGQDIPRLHTHLDDVHNPLHNSLGLASTSTSDDENRTI